MLAHSMQQRRHNQALTLKRTLTDHKLLKKDSLALSTLTSESRQKDHITVRQFSIDSKTEPDHFLDKQELENSLCSDQTDLTEQKSWRQEASILKVQNQITEIIGEDVQQSFRIKDQKSNKHGYQQRQDSEHIWISRPKWVPNQVLKAHQAVKIHRKDVNYLQGFLSQIGFMYYAVQRKIYFYDIESMNEDSSSWEVVETEEKMIKAFYGIQILHLGPPYLNPARRVFAFFHLNEVELYSFEVNKHFESQQRHLLIKCLNVSFIIDQLKPNKLIVTNDGIVHYIDDKGDLQMIKYDNSFLNEAVSQITTATKRMAQIARKFWKTMTSNIGRNIVHFSKSALTFGRHLFTKLTKRQLLEYDPYRNLIYVYHCNQRGTTIFQQLKVYNTTDLKPSCTLQDQQFMEKQSAGIVVVNMKYLESRLNNDYNLVMLLSSGKRIFLDVTQDGIRKKVIYQSVITSFSKVSGTGSLSSFEMDSNLLQETYFSTLFHKAQSSYFSLIREQTTAKYEVAYQLNLQFHGEPHCSQFYTYHRDLQEIGTTKHQILSNEQRSIKAQNMNSDVQGAFFHPQQLIHSSDMMLQRIVMLRSVDLIFTLANQLQNIPQILRALPLLMKSVQNQTIIGYCCQILLDEEGVYYISPKLVTSTKTKLSIKVYESDRRRKNTEIQTVPFRHIEKQTMSRVEELLVNLACEYLDQNQDNREVLVANGILHYFSKIVRPIWFADINDLNDKSCMAMLSVVECVRQLIKKIKKRIRLTQGGLLTSIEIWNKRFRQLLIIVKTIPSLPQKMLHQAMTLQPKQMSAYLFAFLVRQCHPRQLSSLRNAVPTYADEDFNRYFKTWLSIKEMKSAEEKIAYCKRQYLPPYLIDHLSKQRGLKDLKILVDPQQISVEDIHNHFERVKSYKQILKCIRQTASKLVEKEILLKKAEQKLKEQSKYSPSILEPGLAEIEEIGICIHLQRLLKLHYQQNKKKSQNWAGRLSRNLRQSKQTFNSVQNHVNHILEHCLFELQALAQLIQQTGDPFLDIAITDHTHRNQLVEKVEHLITTEIQSDKDLSQIIKKLRQMLSSFLTKLKISIDKEVIFYMLIHYFSQRPEVIEQMNSPTGLLEKETFFVLSDAVFLLGKPLEVYQWAIKTAKKIEKNSSMHFYLNSCILHLLLDYLRDKKEEFIAQLVREDNNQLLFKKIIAILEGQITGSKANQ